MKITFGKYKGIPLRDIPQDYLCWMVKNLKNTDMHQWALDAQSEIDSRKAEDLSDLDKEADRLLREAGEI